MKDFSMRTTLSIALAAAALSAAAQAQTLEVLHCEIPSSPKSIAQGALDLAGAPEVTNLKSLESIVVSADGSTWLATGRTQQGTSLEIIMLKGNATSDGTMFLQEGQPVPDGSAGELIEFFGSGLGRFDDANRFAMSLRARGGVASVFQKVLMWDGVNWTMRAEMGDLYTGLSDILTNPSGDEIVGNSIGSIHLLNDGRIGAQDSTIGNISTTRRPAIFYDLAMFHQTNVTTVTNLAGSGSDTWGGISANTFYSSPDGAHWIAIGTIAGAPSTENDMLVYDGQVVIQEGKLIPSTSITAGAIFAADIARNGDWFARGRDSSGTSAAAPDWAVRNGVLIAQTGDPISGSENLGDTFSGFTGNAVGDWVLTANTDNADAGLNEVLLWNGVVVAREGDPVDIDGNGLFDDNAFLGRGNNTLSCFQANDLQLTDNNVLYFLASIRDGSGVDLNSSPSFGTPDALFRVALVPQCGATVAYCTAGTSTNGCNASISGTGTPSASAGSGFTLDVTNVEGQKAGLLFYGINGPATATWGSGSSFLCVKAPNQRMGSQSSGGTPNLCDGTLSEDFNTYLSTHPTSLGQPFAGGETVWAQAWFRDPPAPKTTNLSNGLQFVLCP
jgi:glucose/arabinose dehydrogenase